MRNRKVQMVLGALSVLLVQTAYAEGNPTSANDKSLFNVEQIDKAMKRFTRAPHPMASAEQKKLTQEIKDELSAEGWDAKLHKFKTKIPNLAHDRLGGTDKNANPIKEVEGENIIAISKGSDRCMLLIGGHYDTKVFKNVKFVGANDGGSSTAVMQELARVISVIRKQEASSKPAAPESGRFLDCSIALTFFDGEEATLPEWSDGEQALGIVDNTYGSRAFAASLQPSFDGLSYQGLPIKMVMVIDMVGHKNQNLFISQGSNPQFAQKLLAQKGNVRISSWNQPMEDDHVPFARLGLPFIHIIDWTNLAEWHKASDTLEITSNKNMVDFGDLLVRFLKQKR